MLAHALHKVVCNTAFHQFLVQIVQINIGSGQLFLRGTTVTQRGSFACLGVANDVLRVAQKFQIFLQCPYPRCIAGTVVVMGCQQSQQLAHTLARFGNVKAGQGVQNGLAAGVAVGAEHRK